MTKKILTDAKIRGLSPARGKRLEVADTIVEGLRLRVSTKTKVWALRVRASGKVRTFTLGSFGDGRDELRLAEARAAAIKVKKELAEGILPKPKAPARSAPDTFTVCSFVKRFMDEYVVDRQIKRPEAYQWQFDKYLLPRIGGRDVRDVKRAELRAVVQEVRDAHGLTTARRAGGLLKRFFAWLTSEDVLEADPAAPMKLPGKEVQRDRTLSDVELGALWLATDPANKPADRNRAGRVKPHPSDYPWGAYFRLLLILGQRRAEVATMRWSAIDLDAGTWSLKAEDVKSSRAHLVPLSPLAATLLRGLPRLSYLNDKGEAVTSDWVLTTNGRAPISDFSKPKRLLDATMAKALKCELPHWVVHDIRRTVSTNLARLGVEPFIRRRVLNHALTGVDAIYDRFDYLPAKRSALEVWAADLRRIASSNGSFRRTF